MLNIAIDGPAGAGKSTVAKAVAKSLGIIYLDTGAMYRAVGLKALRNGIDPKDREASAALMADTKLNIEYNNGVQAVILDGEDVSGYIRTGEVSIAASDISAHPEVREALVEAQRRIAEKNDVIMDGRDIGTHVLPKANCKFYVTASPEERARRRYAQDAAKGDTSKTEEEILRDIIQRDYNDINREFAPLKQADDAVLIDTTNMTEKEVIQKVLRLINEKKKPGGTKRKISRFKVYRFFLFWIFRLLFPTKVVNKKQMDTSGPLVVVCNHMSLLDPIMIFGYSPRDVIFLAKKELFKNKVLAVLLKMMRVVSVDRGQSDIEAIKKILKALKANEAVGIFPQGTRCPEGEVGELQTGAAMIALKGKADIQVLAYTRKIKLFRRTKLVVGKTIDISRYAGRKADHAVLTEISEEIRTEINRILSEY